LFTNIVQFALRMLVEFLRYSSKVSNLNQTVSYYFNVTISKDVYKAGW